MKGFFQKLSLPLFSGLLFLTAGIVNGQSAKPSQAPPPYYNFENLRSGTFDILTYSINLQVSSPTTVNLSGYTSLRYATKMNNQSHIRLDLLKLTIDSVKEN